MTNLAAFRDLFDARACEVCQLDITHCGGLSEARRIAALAEAHRIALAPHNPQGPVSTAASLEFGFSQPSYIICETVHADVPWRQDVVQEGFTVEPKGRIVRPNTRPGLGIDDQRSGSEEASVRAGTAAARVLPGRQRGRLVVGQARGLSSNDRPLACPTKDTMPKKLHGVLPIVHTPFTDDDEIDARVAAARGRLGVRASAPTASAPAWCPRRCELTTDERVDAARACWSEFAAGRGPVFAAVGAESTKQAVAFAVAAEKAGCDAVMAVPPLTARLRRSAAGPITSARIADAVGDPGHRAGRVAATSGRRFRSACTWSCSTATARRRFSSSRKRRRSGRTSRRCATRPAAGPRIFEGSGGIFLVDSFRRGIAGTMPGMDLLDGVVAMWKALQRGDDATAYRVYFPVCAIVALATAGGARRLPRGREVPDA